MTSAWAGGADQPPKEQPPEKAARCDCDFPYGCICAEALNVTPADLDRAWALYQATQGIR